MRGLMRRRECDNSPLTAPASLGTLRGEGGPAVLTTPRAVAPPDETGDAVRILSLADPLPAGGGSFSYSTG